MRLLFLVRSLDLGGAERQLVALARGLRARGHEISIAVFYAGGRFEPELRAAGIEVHDLRKRGRWELARLVARLAALVRALRPDVLHAYMEANVFAAALRPLFPDLRIVWGIRSAKTTQRDYGRLERLYPWLERLLARVPDQVIVNSHAARRQAVANGLEASRVAVVPNGIDVEAFRPDPAGRAEVRARWGVPPGAPLVGMVARLDPIKNHGNFLRAAARLAAARPDLRFACVADAAGRPGYAARLRRLGDELGLAGRLAWADEGKVSRAVYCALDVAVLSSNPGESFPNVLGEAMACGTPAVATDSGDAALIVGEVGAVAPPRDPIALARAILSVLDRLAAGGLSAAQARSRIEAAYSLEQLAARTEAVLDAGRRLAG